LRDRINIKSAERLVEQPDGRAPIYQACQGGAFPLTCREIPHGYLKQGAEPERMVCQARFVACVDLLPECERLAQWGVRIESGPFVEQPDFANPRCLARKWLEQSSECADEGGLTAAVAARDMQRLATLECEREAAEQHAVTAATSERAGCQRGSD